MSNSAALKLKASILAGREMHGYIITGADTAAVEKLMTECAALLLFGNEDVDRLPLSPDYMHFDGTIRVDKVRDVRKAVNITGYTGVNRAVLISNAHLMNGFSINAMLKMLEEPPEGTHFFLSGIEQRIIPTIRSRCMIVRLGSGDELEVRAHLTALGASEKDAEFYADASGNSSTIAEKLYSDAAFRALREGSIKAFIAMLRGELPLDCVKLFGSDRAAAASGAEFMLSACHDLFAYKSGSSADVVLSAPDFSNELRSTAMDLDYSALGAVSDALIKTIERLTSNAKPTHIIDRLILDIHSICT